jgi:hypothetical protein
MPYLVGAKSEIKYFNQKWLHHHQLESYSKEDIYIYTYTHIDIYTYILIHSHIDTYALRGLIYY